MYAFVLYVEWDSPGHKIATGQILQINLECGSQSVDFLLEILHVFRDTNVSCETVMCASSTVKIATLQVLLILYSIFISMKTFCMYFVY